MGFDTTIYSTRTHSLRWWDRKLFEKNVQKWAIASAERTKRAMKTVEMSCWARCVRCPFARWVCFGRMLEKDTVFNWILSHDFFVVVVLLLSTSLLFGLFVLLIIIKNNSSPSCITVYSDRTNFHSIFTLIRCLCSSAVNIFFPLSLSEWSVMRKWITGWQPMRLHRSFSAPTESTDAKDHTGKCCVILMLRIFVCASNSMMSASPSNRSKSIDWIVIYCIERNCAFSATQQAAATTIIRWTITDREYLNHLPSKKKIGRNVVAMQRQCEIKRWMLCAHSMPTQYVNNHLQQ